MKTNYLCLNDSVIVNFEGKTFNIHSDDPRFNKVMAAIRSRELDTLPELCAVVATLNHADLTVNDDCVYLDGEALPDVLNQRVLEYMRQSLPFDSLVKFTRKLKENPSLNSRKMLYAFLEHNGHPITESGNFIAYRGVRENFKDCYSGSFDNSVGSVCEMDRSQVDDNPNNTCSNGLHVACWDYARGFGQVNIEVEVDPMDVVCVPTDYNGTKMRVCRFKVLAVCENMRDETVYGVSKECSNDEDSSSYSYEITYNESESMSVKSVTYNEDCEELCVYFRNGSSVSYLEVPKSEASDVKFSENLDNYLLTEIVPFYEAVGV